MEAIACVNEETVPLQYISRRRSKFLDRDYVFEHFFWVPLGPHDYLRVLLERRNCATSCVKRGTSGQWRHSESYISL